LRNFWVFSFKIKKFSRTLHQIIVYHTVTEGLPGIILMFLLTLELTYYMTFLKNVYSKMDNI